MDTKDSRNKTRLSTQKYELLAYLLKEKGIKLPQTQTTYLRENSDKRLLSFSQQRLWFLDQLMPKNPAYNLPIAVRIFGRLNAAILEQSINEIIQRHEVLRTCFLSVNEQPTLFIHSAFRFILPIINLQQIPETERQFLALQLATEEAQQLFDLTQGPLLRAKLLYLSPEEHILLLTMHHIICDGWSLGVFVREMTTLYEAFSTKMPSPLPELPIQYADFALWQHQSPQKETLSKTQLNYWKQQLGGNLNVLELPTDRPRPPVQTFRGAKQALVLPKSLSKAIADLSRQEGVTLFMTLLTAFKTLLYRYTGQEDIIVGSPIANRNHNQTDILIGFFVNTLILRTELGDNPTFKELLLRVREVVLGAYEYQDLPFEKLLEAIRIERNLSHSPLFQVMFTLQNIPMPNLEFSGLTLTPLEVDNKTAKFDLSLELSETPEGLRGWFEYNTDLFDGSTIGRMVSHFQTLLKSIVANREQRLSDLPLLTPVEREQLLEQWNCTQTDHPKDICIHQLFAAQAKRTPDAVAIVYEDQYLTYHELDVRAHQLAVELQNLGVGAEVIVGICMERSLEMMVGLLAILKAGGAYLALDPDYPPQRLAFMLHDAKVSVLLTQQHLQERLPECNALVVCIDTQFHTLTHHLTHNLVCNSTSENLAYVIYTSGSTGHPKGVMVTHRAVVNFLSFMREQINLTDGDIFLAVTTLSFDIAALELFLPITVGACVLIVSREVSSDGTQLLEKLNSSGVAVMQATPATWKILIETGWKGSSHLKILCGGEALSNKLARQLQLRGACCWNLYGPSETTIWSTIFKLESKNRLVYIGQPIANTQVYLLDDHLQPVPIGVPGEIYIGGDGLANGYLNRPELTAEKFIPHPFSDQPGARLYKTGDLGRYREHGNIEYLRRIDHQVKLRGFRIEIGEIESAINQHPGIQEAVVMLREDIAGEPRLVAYIVTQQQTLTTSELRNFLKQQLPEYMVPAIFVMLERLPLTPNGKVDRRALPIPDVARPQVQVAFVTPRTPLDQLLAGIWAEVLGIEQVGIYDNFFELGGHSLLATQVVSRIRKTLQVELPLRRLFELGTIAELAESVELGRWTQPSVKSLPIQPVTRDHELPLSFAQQRLWFLEQLEPDTAMYNLPSAVRLTGRLDITALQQALNEIVRRHEVLRTRFVCGKGEPVQVIMPVLNLSLPIISLKELPAVQQEKEVQHLAMNEAQRPFDLSSDPLLRTSLLHLAEQQYVFLVTMHHIICDGWSIGVFIQELVTLYQAFALHQPSPLAELSLQYADFASWQRAWLQGQVLEVQIDYWKKQLANLPILQLPTDRARPSVQTFQGDTQSFLVPASLATELKALSQREGVTLFMTLLAAFQTLLYRYTQQHDIAVGTPIAHRNRSEVEGLIGFFVNTLVLRIDLSGQPSFQQLLARVREVTLDAYTHQDVPFEQLVEILQPQRHLNYSPLFQVMFVLQNAPMPALELADLTLEPLEVNTKQVQFDLILSMVDTDQGLTGLLEYNSDLFDRATITRMLGHFQTLLESIATHPQQNISSLPLLTSTERKQLLVQWNDTVVDFPQDVCIHQLFTAQVKHTPDAVAAVYEDRHLTYHELDVRSHQLAVHLQSLGVGAEVIVGICMERSLEMIVGLIAILKAGGAYLPLDPDYPPQRLAFMLQDAQVSVLLTQQHLIERLPKFDATTMCLDTQCHTYAQNLDHNLVSDSTTENLAYVIYTSGSTGQPKGVMVTHQALVNYTQAIAKQLNFQAHDRVLQFASISFDVLMEEIFPAWFAGATVVLVDQSRLLSYIELLDIIKQYRITALELPAAYWHRWVHHLCQSQARLPEFLRLVMVGCEKIIPEYAAAWQNNFNIPLVHVYGLTESTITSTLHITTLDANTSTPTTNLPIGRPIANTQIYLLDDQLNPVPVGIPGHVYIGGAGLARGYLHQPGLSAEKFIPHPFSSQPGDRLYKTGDLACYWTDGNLEYLGRGDRQANIRGFRIELREIELALLEYPTVQETVVQVSQDDTAEKRLVAYIVTSQERSLPVSEWRSFLRKKLPEYMLPDFFVTLKLLPLTSNGKIDYKALPAPNGEIKQEGEYIPPRTPTQEIIANIFGQVLGVELVGIHDNFFELGGHSLLATQLISRLRQAFEVEVPLRALFEAPTVEQLDQILTALRSSKQGLSLPPIEAVARDTHSALPLSWAQERLWFLDQLQGQSATYNIPGAVRVTGKLNFQTLEQTLSEIVRRHEVLRTSFKSVNGTPVQVIEPEANLAVGVVNLHHLCEVEQKTQVQQLASQEAMTPFDLSTGPLLRVTVLELSASESVVLLTMHHIISDGWSMGLLLNELSVLYQAFSQGETSPLAELPIQYADFTLWQRQWLSTSVLEKQLNYWLSHLAGAPALLELPTDRPRPAIQSYRGATYEFQLNAQLTQKLQILSRESGTTLFMTLLGAFATLLYRYSGQSDILIGSPIANRNRKEIESLIGFFVNTLVLKTSFESEPSFAELLTQVREVTLKAYDNQDVPFEQVVDALKPERSLSHSPLFQVMFALENTPMGELEFPELTLTPLKSESVIAKFDLTLSIEETTAGLVSSWEYNLDLFDCATITRMASHFHNILEAIVENPQQRVSQLPLLSQAERHQLLMEWNDTATEYPSDKCIHQLFEQQVEKTPDAVALVFEEQQLTYRQLNQRSNQLAQHLRSLGVGPEVLVGICVERSIEMVVGLLGILKAGGAYVPLDPSYPAERLAYMLSDSAVSVFLTQELLLESLPQHQGYTVCLDSDWGEIEQHSQDHLDAGVTSENLAYVMYTSGSTGQPKGVAIQQQSLVNHSQAIISKYGLTCNDRTLQFANFGFDVALEEIFPTLVSGATLVIGEKMIFSSFTHLHQLIEQQKLTVLNLPASYCQRWVGELAQLEDADLPLSLRLIVVGSETVSWEQLALWFKHRRENVSWRNAYGSTEATITATVYEPRTNFQSQENKLVPIGRPIANTSIYILDRHLQPVPIGVSGELHIGGVGLARGYLNRSKLTLEKFITNPFKEGRLYKTGDLARYLPDGNIEFLGRIDNQVKIRGFRIELGEIESVLSAQGEVESCVVIATENTSGNKSLVAYVVTKSESCSESQLRKELKQKLPGYMVPSAFVFLDKLPLTPNGKVDRKALPTPDEEISREGEYVPPSTPTQERISNIFAQILGLEAVSIYDNFFELGGHSLLATQLISRIRQIFEVDISLKSFFEEPTTAHLSEIIDKNILLLVRQLQPTPDQQLENREEIEL